MQLGLCLSLLSLFVMVCLCLSLFLIVCHRLLLIAIVCHCLQWIEIVSMFEKGRRRVAIGSGKELICVE